MWIINVVNSSRNQLKPVGEKKKVTIKLCVPLVCQVLSGQWVKYLRFLLQKNKWKNSRLEDWGSINCLLACVSSSPLALLGLLLCGTDERADKIFTISQTPWDLLWLHQLGLPVLPGVRLWEDKGSLCLQRAWPDSAFRWRIKCPVSVQVALRWFRRVWGAELAHQAGVTGVTRTRVTIAELPRGGRGTAGLGRMLSIGVGCSQAAALGVWYNSRIGR